MSSKIKTPEAKKGVREMSDIAQEKGIVEKVLDFAEEHKAEIGMFVATVAIDGLRRLANSKKEETKSPEGEDKQTE